MTPKKHIPVLTKEVVSYLARPSSKAVIDCTVGLGGHTHAISQKLCSEASILAFDKDKNNLLVAEDNLKNCSIPIHFVHSSFKNLLQYARKYGFTKVDGILFDLGVSSPHLDDGTRGFSFKNDGPLDMRFDQTQSLDAARFIHSASEEDLIYIFKHYGEIHCAKRIASAIVTERKNHPLQTTFDLSDFIQKTLNVTDTAKILPLVFQSLRIAVNDELQEIHDALHDSVDLLRPGGRLVVISYHSLEDRIAKKVFKYYSQQCVCDKLKPICTCQDRKKLNILTRKPITPSQNELDINPRSRSAKMRVAEKLQLP